MAEICHHRQYINWQDFCDPHCQNIRRHSPMGGDKLVADVVESIGLKFRFPLFLTNEQRLFVQINALNEIQIDAKH